MLANQVLIATSTSTHKQPEDEDDQALKFMSLAWSHFNVELADLTEVIKNYNVN